MHQPADLLRDHQSTASVHGNNGIANGICHGRNCGSKNGRKQGILIRWDENGVWHRHAIEVEDRATGAQVNRTLLDLNDGVGCTTSSGLTVDGPNDRERVEARRQLDWVRITRLDRIHWEIRVQRMV